MDALLDQNDIDLLFDDLKKEAIHIEENDISEDDQPQLKSKVHNSSKSSNTPRHDN